MTARCIWCCVCVRVFVSAPIPSLSVSLATVRVTSCPADNSSAACAGDKCAIIIDPSTMVATAHGFFMCLPPESSSIDLSHQVEEEGYDWNTTIYCNISIYMFI